jgi:hypothetical protein
VLALADGVLLEPLAALPLGEELGELLIEPLALLEPPAAESFLVASDEDELELDGDAGVEIEPDAELEPDGELGAALEPADDEEPGAVREAARSPGALSPQAVRPSAREIATARVESLISGPPWVGVKVREQDSGPCV